MSHSIELGQADNARDLIRAAAALFEDAGLFYGHGTDNALEVAPNLLPDDVGRNNEIIDPVAAVAC